MQPSVSFSPIMESPVLVIVKYKSVIVCLNELLIMLIKSLKHNMINFSSINSRHSFLLRDFNEILFIIVWLKNIPL